MFPFNITNPGIYIEGLLTSIEAQLVSDLAGITYATGDILYYDGAQLNKLAAGTDGHVLTLASGIPSWAAGGSGGASAFTDLTDTPGAYTGEGGRAVRVNAGATGLEFVDFPTGTGDVTAASVFGTDNRLIRSDGTSKGVQASGITLSDTDNLSGVGTINTHTIPGGTGTFALTSQLHNAVTIGTANGLSLSTQALSLALATTSVAGAMSAADKTKLDGVATGANNYSHPNHSGDVTSTGDGATVISNGAVTLAKQANVDTATVFYRKTAGAGAPEVQTLATLKTDLGLTGTNSGDQTLPTRDSLGLDTDDSPQFAGVNVGHATDTTLSRVSAGVVAVDGVTLPTVSSTSTLTNKTLTDAKLQTSVNSQTGTTYTLVLADASKHVTMSNGSANTLTVPPNSSVAFAVGTRLMVQQLGAGSTTIAAGSGVTINAPSTVTLAIGQQYESRGLLKTATDTWQLI